MRKELLSVVVPVYNVRPYLKRCLDSIINQTYTNLEIICIDDGSIDGCADILDIYAKQDNRIKVIHKENQGYGAAINTGMSQASGEYIGIVESDDFIAPEMYEVLFAEAQKYDLDFIKSDFYRYWEKPEYCLESHNPLLEPYQNRLLEHQEISTLWDFEVANWSGIYKCNFLKENAIFHHESPGASYQDMGFWAQVLAMAQRGMWLDRTFYYYFQDNPGSSMKSKEKMMILLQEYRFVEDIFQRKHLLEIMCRFNRRRMFGHRWNFERIDDSLKRAYADVIIDDYYTIKHKIQWNGSAYERRIQEWLEHLLQDPDGFCKDYIQWHTQLTKRLEECENIVLYGAGRIAKNVFEWLLQMGYGSKILFFAETSPIQSRRFCSLEVKNAEEIVPIKQRTLVVISVSKRTGVYTQVENNLKALGVTNYIDFHELYPSK